MMKNFYHLSLFLLLAIGSMKFEAGYGQTYPGACPAFTDNKTGQSAANCSPAASNFTGSWATVPAGTVTGFYKFTYTNFGTAASLFPYAITRVVLTTTTAPAVSNLVTNPVFGPASKVGNNPPNSTNVDVFYCYYGLNGDVIPAAGILSLEFKQPVNGSTTAMICSYDLATSASVATPGGVSGVLPLSFATLSAREGRSGVDILWSIERETNIKGYHIQRSIDGLTFTDLAFVGTQALGGSSDTRKNYTFSDRNMNTAGSSLFYRIRQEDLSGINTYSKVVSLHLSKMAYGFSVITRPGKIGLKKNANLPAGNYSVSLIGAEGARRATRYFNNSDEVSFENLPGGLYYLQVVSDKGDSRTFTVKAR